jgi:hypothetical protein
MRRVVALHYSNEREVRVLDTIPDDLLGGESSPRAYAPQRRIDPSALPPYRACTLLIDVFSPDDCQAGVRTSGFPEVPDDF